MDFNHYYINRMYNEDIAEIRKLVEDPSRVQTCLYEPVEGFSNWMINLPV